MIDDLDALVRRDDAFVLAALAVAALAVALADAREEDNECVKPDEA